MQGSGKGSGKFMETIKRQDVARQAREAKLEDRREAEIREERDILDRERTAREQAVAAAEEVRKELERERNRGFWDRLIN